MMCIFPIALLKGIAFIYRNTCFLKICRDINKIKVCMETGMPVILLNMENLYESLYDALNQASRNHCNDFSELENLFRLSFLQSLFVL